jgi:hypothetical protein
MMINPDTGRELQRRFARDPGNRLLQAGCHYDYDPTPDSVGDILNTLHRAQADADDAAMIDALCRGEAELKHCLRVVRADHLLANCGSDRRTNIAPKGQRLGGALRHAVHNEREEGR